jgi:hypothetical protein
LHTLEQQLANPDPCFPLDQDEPPGPQTAVIGNM